MGWMRKHMSCQHADAIHSTPNRHQKPIPYRYLAESLRAILALEARTLTVDAVATPDQHPRHLPADLCSVVCTCTSASGVPARVVLGGPEHGACAR